MILAKSVPITINRIINPAPIPEGIIFTSINVGLLNQILNIKAGAGAVTIWKPPTSSGHSDQSIDGKLSFINTDSSTN